VTKKDYVLIACALAKMPTHAPTLRSAKASAASTLADALAQDNPRFDRARFLAACGVEK
jgi:hypothetical protein